MYIAFIAMYIAMMYIPSYHEYPWFNTMSWHTTKPIILPKLGQVAQNPSNVVSLSGEHTLWTSGNKLGQVKDCKYPLTPIKKTNIAKADPPVIKSIDIGTKQYYMEHSSIATHNALIGLLNGQMAITKLPNPINNNITESTIPINCSYILIYCGKYDLLNE